MEEALQRDLPQDCGDNPINVSCKDCIYTSCYCEENVWKLCKFVEDNHPSLVKGSFAVFISNENRQIPLWMQKAAGSPEGLVVWDYHVIFIHKASHKVTVYDLDTTLPFPCPFQKYVSLSLRSEENLQEQFHRKFRVIPCQLFLETFASDRSHMKKKDGSYQKPPPSYPCIFTKESTMNLDNFISMNKGSWHGNVFTLGEFIQHFNT